MSKRIIRGGSASSSPPFAEIANAGVQLSEELNRSLGHKRGRIEKQLEELRVRAEREGSERGRDQGYEEGRLAGYADGYEEGLKQGLIESPRIIRELQDISANVHEAIARWYPNAVQELTELSIAVARKILEQELRTNEEAILALTSNALQELKQATEVRILVNPFESEVLRKHKSRLLSQLNGLAEITIVDDAAIENGCRIESDNGEVDATIDRQLGAFLAELRRAA